ncbi:MAG TPA: hypothetical protein VEG42_00735 [Thermoplasmata archaeon]|nr:hypothetical protein [Thermoplasmata archaeon]
MRQVVRVAAYLPQARGGGLPVPAFDEDEFTLAATAVERAWVGRQEEPGRVSVHLVGEFPSVVEWGFAPLLGHECEVVRHRPGFAELVSTVRVLEEERDGAAFVVAAALDDKGGGRAGSRGGPSGPGAVAFLLESAEEASPFPFDKASPARSALAGALRLGDPGHTVPRTVTFVGDWDRRSAAKSGEDERPSRRAIDTALTSVSEGAYVPRARYLENLPSRWRFVAEVCGACHGTTFPARGVCRKCGRSDMLTALTLPLDGGRVVAVTTVGKGGQPTEFDAQVEATGPYDVALVELARGMRVTLQVTDAPAGTLAVGDHVNTRLRRLYSMEGEWRYGRKAVPIGPKGSPHSAGGA